MNKSNTKISTHYWIICLYSKNLFLYVFVTNKCFSFFWNMFYSERINLRYIIILYVQNNPMSSNIRVLSKIYYVWPILYFSGTAFRQIISWITTIKSWLILIIFFFSKLVKGWAGIKNPFCFYDLVFYSHYQL